MKEELIGQTVEIWSGAYGIKGTHKILDIADGLMKLQTQDWQDRLGWCRCDQLYASGIVFKGLAPFLFTGRDKCVRLQHNPLHSIDSPPPDSYNHTGISGSRFYRHSASPTERINSRQSTICDSDVQAPGRSNFFRHDPQIDYNRVRACGVYGGSLRGARQPEAADDRRGRRQRAGDAWRGRAVDDHHGSGELSGLRARHPGSGTDACDAQAGAAIRHGDRGRHRDEGGHERATVQGLGRGRSVSGADAHHRDRRLREVDRDSGGEAGLGRRTGRRGHLGLRDLRRLLLQRQRDRSRGGRRYRDGRSDLPDQPCQQGHI